MNNRLKDFLKEVGEGYFGSYETKTVTEVTEGDFYITKSFKTDRGTEYLIIFSPGGWYGLKDWDLVEVHFDVRGENFDASYKDRSKKEVFKIIQTVVGSAKEVYEKHGDLFDAFLFFDIEGEYDQEPNNIRERMYKKFIRKNFSNPTIERYMQREYDGWVVKP